MKTKRVWIALAICAVGLGVGSLKAADSPYVTVWTGAGPVSSSNPLPVTGGGGGGGGAITAPLCDTGAAVCTFSLNSALPTMAPGGFPGFSVTDTAGTALTAVVPTATPAAAVAGLPVTASVLAQCGTSGLMCPLVSGGQAAAAASRNPLDVILCNSTAGSCQNILGTGADGISNSTFAAATVLGYMQAFNGTTWDRVRTMPSPCPVGILATGADSNGAACDIRANTSKAFTGLTVNTTTSELAVNASTSYYISSWSCASVGTVSLNCTLISGTGAACTSPVILDYIGAQSATNFTGNRQFNPPLKVAAASGVCVSVNATTSTNNYGEIYYTNF